MADGSIRIDIVGDDKDLQRKLKEIERLEKEKAKIEVKIESRDNDWAKIEAKLNKEIDKYYEMLDKKASIEAKKITMPAMDLGTGEYQEESFYLEKDQEELDKINAKIDDQNFKMDELQAKQKSLVELRKQDESVLAEVNSKINIAGVEADKVDLKNFEKSTADVNKNLSKIGSGIKGVIQKVVKWGMALVGIRSAYMGIRRLMSTLSQFNEQLKVDLSYIGFAIAKTFEPLILRIVELIYKALAYVKYILSAWFGINIFANSTAEAFKAGNSAMGGMVQGAKELKRQLAGFDEMNRLSEGLDGGGGAGGGGGVGGLDPSFDLSKIDVPIPKWVDWIAKNKDKILKWAIALAGVIAGFKIASWIAKIGHLAEGLGKVGSILKGVFGSLTLIQGLGIAVGIAGVIIAIQGVIAAIKDPAFPNFMTIMEGIGLAILGVGIVIGNVPAMIVGAGIAIAGLAGKFTYASTEAGRLEKANKELKDATDELVDAKWRAHDAQLAIDEATDNLIRLVKREKEVLEQLQQAEKESGITGKELQEQIDKGTRSLEDLSVQELNVLGLYREKRGLNKQITEGTKELTTATKKKTEADIEAEEKQKQLTATMYKNQAQTISSEKEFNKFKDSVVKAFNKGELTAEEASDAIAVAMAVMKKKSVKEVEGLPKAIENNLSDEKLKNTRNSVIGWGERLMTSLRGIFGRTLYLDIVGGFTAGGGDGSGGGGGGSRNAKGAVYLPKLATGGIINYPNHRSSFRKSNRW